MEMGVEGNLGKKEDVRFQIVAFVVATLLLQITSLNSLQNLAYRKPLVLEIITWHILIDPDETTCDVL